MNRSNYFDYVESKLNFLSFRIELRGKINLFELNIHSETFFSELLNLLLKTNLININSVKQNTEAIDLIDEKNEIYAQVSSTCSKQKIENSLGKKTLLDYPGFHFIFIAIAGDAEKLRSKTYNNPNNILFSPDKDIYDIKSIIENILYLQINEQRAIYQFIKDELGDPTDLVKVDTNLASIINILSKEDFTNTTNAPVINSFEIVKKIKYNDLISVQPKIDDYKVFYSRLDDKYSEFDKQGANKSLSVLSIIQSEYIKLSGKINNPHELFFSIIDEVIEIVKNSKNYIEIPYEELEMCVSILVVDAFIRCKIFKNPEGYNHVTTR